MDKVYTEGKTFNSTDFTESGLSKGDYEGCIFSGCNFSGTDLSEIVFAECEFRACNLSMAKLAKTALRDVTFKECKLTGLHFQNCNEFLFEVYFENCILNLSSFYRRSLKKITFRNTSLHEVDFTETDLSAAVFDHCDLMSATFDNTILEKADLRTSYNYSIDPAVNRIRKAKFSMTGVAGLLHTYDIEIE